MSEDELQLTNAREYGEQYLIFIEEAVAASDPNDMRMSIGDASAISQSMLDCLEDAMASADSPELSYRLEEAVQFLCQSMDVSDQAIEVNDEDLTDLVAEMRRYAIRAVDNLGLAIDTMIA